MQKDKPDEVIDWYYGNQEQLATVESSVIEDQVFDYIIGEAQISDTQLTYEEVIKSESQTKAKEPDESAAAESASG